MKDMISEMRKDFTMLKTFEIKPNFQYLAHKYDMDPRTVKRYYDGYDGKPATRDKPSKLDEYYDVIKEKISLPGCKMSSLYFYLKNELNYEGSYSSLTYFIRNDPELKKSKLGKNSHVRYETSIGEVVQFDWVEDITLINKYGEVFTFNVFSAELCYSRFHYFGYSKNKTREDVYVQLIRAFQFFGGTSKGILTDNMSSIVNTAKLEFNSEFKAFAKDIGIEINKCKVKHPFTKGKVEVRNKFVKWLIPYNFEFENEQDIIKILEKINITVNNKINSTTNMKPILLYKKEKEYLKPLPSNQILQYYMNLSTSVIVQNTSLIHYKGNKYSVPPKYINKTLKIREIDNKLYIYDNTELVTIHNISDKKINYNEEDYINNLKLNLSNKDDTYIEDLAKKNLQLFDEIANIGRDN